MMQPILYKAQKSIELGIYQLELLLRMFFTKLLIAERETLERDSKKS